MDNLTPVALTIAGSDSSGGSGIQADLKTFQRFGVYGCSALTCITAQNTLGIAATKCLSRDLLERQIEAVVTDIKPSSLKTGMLGTASLVQSVASTIKRWRLNNYVLDPVMVSTSGHSLLDELGCKLLSEQLIPLATIVTPNLHEARKLTGHNIDSPDELKGAAKEFLRMGASSVLIKGGHFEEGLATDFLLTNKIEKYWSRPVLKTTAGHGTGCTLSAALAAELAKGTDICDSAEKAISFVNRALATAPMLGKGSSPINHFVDTNNKSDSSE
ncbi:MAG: bifunctional hydroxymethylpyrimidine kinase/phosphomethylpyrimidine kinase [Gemmatimonadetes bacterium]|nr:bifunctional hydroxymethylpyrimidine kinase/phosphomethylpyrimidine kinase [Gemmatimonadota bacterium]